METHFNWSNIQLSQESCYLKNTECTSKCVVEKIKQMHTCSFRIQYDPRFILHDLLISRFVLHPTMPIPIDGLKGHQILGILSMFRQPGITTGSGHIHLEDTNQSLKRDPKKSTLQKRVANQRSQQEGICRVLECIICIHKVLGRVSEPHGNTICRVSY